MEPLTVPTGEGRMDEQGLVRVRVRVRTEGGASESEVVWASVEEGAAPATYRLQNHALFAMLAAGDIVRALPDGSGVLQVVDVVRPVDAVLTLVGQVWGAAPDLDAVMERWRAAGAGWTEGVAGALATVWAKGMSAADVLEVIRPELEGGTFELLDLAPPEHRTREALVGVIDFDLS